MEAARDRDTAGPRRHLIVLVRLQSLDRERDANRRRVDQTAPLVAARRQKVDAAKAAQAQAQEELKRARMKAHEAEVDLREQSENIRRLELQLNTAKTNQEYQALQSHIGRIREQTASEEESTLALYEEIETREAAVARAAERLVALEREYQEFVATCESDSATAEAELAGTEDRRQALLDELPADIRATYERVRTAREGVAIVPSEDRCCSGCGVRIRPNDYARLMSASQIITCESCQRVLYLPEALSAPEG